MKYNDYLKKLSEKFEKRLTGLSADYNFDYGDEFEIAICDIIRDFLPSKYGVCRGFVVNSLGEKAGDDIIIYDRERFPTLRLLKEDLSRKEHIPIEAVYAYIEAKHTLDKNTIHKSLDQIKDVKTICSTRLKVDLEQIDNYLSLPDKIKYVNPDLPGFRNPLFAMIIGRKCNNGTKSPNDNEITSKFLQKEISAIPNINSPDFIVAGKYHYIGAGIDCKDHIDPTIFIHPDKQVKYYMKTSELSFGMSLGILFYAIDWIKLGPMPWYEMINEIMD